MKEAFNACKYRKQGTRSIRMVLHRDYYINYSRKKIDAQTKELLAHAISTSLKMDFVIESLDKLAKYDFAEGAMIHSEQGVHYTSKAFREKVANMGLEQSMSRRGNCLDNSAMESFFGHMKQEKEFDKDATDEEIEKQLEDYIHDYWHNRYQEGLGEMTPYEYGQSLLAA